MYENTRWTKKESSVNFFKHCIFLLDFCYSLLLPQHAGIAIELYRYMFHVCHMMLLNLFYNKIDHLVYQT